MKFINRKSVVSMVLILSYLISTIGEVWAAGVTVNSGATLRMNNAPTLRTNGDWNIQGTFSAGSGTVVLNGTTSTTLTAGSSSFNNLTLNKTAAADANDNVTASGASLTVTGALNLTDGELVQGATNFTFASTSIAAAGKYSNASTGDLTLGGGLANAGTISLNGGGGGSGDADSILIRSSVSGTQRDWSGAGTFTMTDVDVRDQTANAVSPGFIFVTSGTPTANNLRWLFDVGALTSINVEPASLVAGAEGDITASFTLANDFPKNGKLVIDFGSGFNAAGLSAVTNGGTIDGTWAIALSNGDGTNDVVTLTRQNDGTQTSVGTAVSLTLENEVKNPVVSGSTGAYTVTTQLSDGTTIDTGNASADTITAGALGAAAVTPASLIVGALGNHVVSFTTANPIPADGKIVIVYPQGFDLTALTQATSTDINGVLSVAVSNQTVTLTRSGGAVVAAGTVIDDLTLASVRNHKTPGTTGSFAITTTTSADVTIDTASASGVTLTASEQLFSVSLKVEPQRVRIGETMTFEATVQNMSNSALQDFDLVLELPAGLNYAGRFVSTGGIFDSVTNGRSLRFEDSSVIPAQESRTVKVQAVVGSNARTGDFATNAYIQINPIISNTASIFVTIVPDPVFEIGTLIGKVFWDRNGNGAQEEGETGLPGVRLATEQGYIITTDQYGRYHIPDFLTGRHLVKVDPRSLPAGAQYTTGQERIVDQTQAMLTKINFGVELPKEVDPDILSQASEGADIQVRVEEGKPQKVIDLSFYQIKRDSKTGFLESSEPDELEIPAPPGIGEDLLPLRIETNFARFVKKYTLDCYRFKRENAGGSDEPGFMPRAEDFERVARVTDDSASEGVFGLPVERDAPQGIRWLHLKAEGISRGSAEAWYALKWSHEDHAVVWSLESVSQKMGLETNGSLVRVTGKTDPGRRVRWNDRESVSSVEDGSFEFERIYEDGEHAVEIEIFPQTENGGDKTVKVVRHVRISNTEFFYAGFVEYEKGQLDLNGNLLQGSSDEQAQATDTWYDEGRLAYYLEGKISGKYFVTASVDTDREKKELYRDLEPEDFFSTYGDESEVHAQADETQDPYFFKLESDQSLVRYGSIETGFGGTSFSDFSRTLQGFKAHHEAGEVTDGYAQKDLTAFWAKGHQSASHAEFKATGGSLYYLRHTKVIRGSEKLVVQTRDSWLGSIRSEQRLAAGQDYSMDYAEGRIRLHRPLGSLTFFGNDITSQGLLGGEPQYLTVDYEYDSRSFHEDSAMGLRYSESFLEGLFRIGTTQVTEERALDRYELKGIDGTVNLPFGTAVDLEFAESKLSPSQAYFSEDGGLSFKEVGLSQPDAGGKAWGIGVSETDIAGFVVGGSYRRLDRDFSSTGSFAEAGAEKMELEVTKDLGLWGQWRAATEETRLKDGGNASSREKVRDDEKMVLVQHRIERGRWTWVTEARSVEGQELNDQWVGAGAAYAVDKKTRVVLEGQKSVAGGETSRVLARLERDIGDSVRLMVQQGWGSQGMASQAGILHRVYGWSSPYDSRGTQAEEWNRSGVLAPWVQGTHATVAKDLGKNATISAGTGTGGTRSLKFTRQRGPGQTLELEQIKTRDEEVSALSDSQALAPGIEKIVRSATSRDRRTGDHRLVRAESLRGEILEGRGSVYDEKERTSSTLARRDLQRYGVGFRPTGHWLLDAYFERVQQQTSDQDEAGHSGAFRVRYMDHEKLEADQSWEVRKSDEASDFLQLLSTGKARYRVNPEWTLLGRYEWSWSKSQTAASDLARFSEIQTGVAFRPIAHDRLNVLADYKYLTDEPVALQLFTPAEPSANERQVYQLELIYDLAAGWEWVEKFAMRDNEIHVLGLEETRSKTQLWAHRLNWRWQDRLGAGAEYRKLTQTLSRDKSDGWLVETTCRVYDALSVALGYNFSEFDSDLNADLGLEKRGWYFRFFYDALRDADKARRLAQKPNTSQKNSSS